MKIVGDKIQVMPAISRNILQIIYTIGAHTSTYTTFNAGQGPTYNTFLMTRADGIITFTHDLRCLIRIGAKGSWYNKASVTAKVRVRKTSNGSTSTILELTGVGNGGNSTTGTFDFLKGDQIFAQAGASSNSTNTVAYMVVMLA